MLLGQVDHQPGEVEDFDVDYSQWVPEGDSVAVVNPSARLLHGEATPALIVDDVRVSQALVVKVRVAGGASGSKWRAQLSLTTVAGLVKEAEFDVMVKEV